MQEKRASECGFGPTSDVVDRGEAIVAVFMKMVVVGVKEDLIGEVFARITSTFSPTRRRVGPVLMGSGAVRAFRRWPALEVHNPCETWRLAMAGTSRCAVHCILEGLDGRILRNTP